MLKTFSGRTASQNEWELRQFIALLQQHGVRRYLEIGARHGDTFHEVMRHLAAGACGVAVDLPGGNWGRDGTEAFLAAALADLQGKGVVGHRILGDSGDPEVLKTIAELGPYDAILIDGDHTYEGVRRDWLNFHDKAPLVAFHDIRGDTQRDKARNLYIEVPRLWNSIRLDQPRTVEFIAPDSLMGIGVVINPETFPPETP